MIAQFGILLSFLAAGEFIVWLTGINIPSSIIGMLLLTASLKAGIVKPSYVERLSNFLVHNLGFFFVPAGVGVMNCFGLISEQWLPIVAASVGSTVIIIAVSGQVHGFVRRALARKPQIIKSEAEV
ncbi:MAG: CidA/LrgA family protein [Muribaculaceae bacterium]|nr:CidA/LrgA family protein [Muribaculaceae bacterium]